MSIYVPLLSISVLVTLVLLVYLMKSKKKNQITVIFIVNIFLLTILSASVLCQLLFAERFNIDPIKFEYFAYIGGCFLPLSVFFTGLIMINGRMEFKLYYFLFFIAPLLSLIMLWTNNIHHLFFVKYSTNMAEGVSGPFMMINNIYSYIFLLLGLSFLLKGSITNGGLFSKQTILILVGVSIPIITNLLGTSKIIPMTIYLTPISFTVTILFLFFAIFKFNFLNVAPITLRKIVDRISDSYIVLNSDNLVAAFNKTFLTTFKIKNSQKYIGTDFKTFLNNINLYLNYNQIDKIIDEIKDSDKTKSFELFVKSIDKYFNIEISSIHSNGQLLGILILFKDITQHKNDIEQIKNNQSILMEKERLATLGAMIGGVAHNLKTPIMSIAGATEGLEDLVNEYKNSVGDPEVTVDDHHAIANDMMEWVTKIRSYDGYMSDIITAVKGQAVNMNENQDESFTVDELLSRVNILMKHELKNGQVALNEDVSIDNSVKFNGNVNSLVQVINNLISNAIQAYPPIDPAYITSATGSSFIKGNGADNGSGKTIGQKISNITTSRTIDLIISSKDDKILIQVVDHASGMPDEVKSKLFKEMITTKGHNGSGLGLFMSFSTIKGNFHGDMTFESELGKGTTFNITLPRK